MTIDPNWLDSTSRKNLSLSILEPDSDHRGGVLTLPGAGPVGDRYRVLLEACQNPRCACGLIRFECQPVPAEPTALPPDEWRAFWLDPKGNTIQLDPKLEKDAESRRLADEVRAALTPEDRERLFQWFRVTKLELIEKASPGEIDLSDLPDAEGGLMVPFIDVFPWGLALHFQMGDEIWAADEQFCVQTDCECKETVISFLKLGKISGEKTPSLKNLPATRYNYKTKAAIEASAGAAGNLPTALLLAALQQACPTLNLHLECRHRLLQNLYVRREATQLRSRMDSAIRRSPDKVGRNDPCPCGSGKKFKRCCLGRR